MIRCPDCDRSFTRSDNLKRHRIASCPKRVGPTDTSSQPNKKLKIATSINSSDRWCDTCKIYIPQASYNGHLRSLKHKQNCCSPLEEGITFLSSAFANRIVSFRISSPKFFLSYTDFFNEVLDKCLRVVGNQIHLHDAFKLNLEVFGRYVHETKELVEVKSFNTNNKVVTQSTDLTDLLQNFFEVLDGKASEFQERESGWTLERVLFLELNFNKYNPLRASSYIPLPKQILLKKAVVNVRNDDQACFAWAITSALYPAQANPHRTTSYPHYSRTLDYDGLEFPIKLTDIPKFESKNQCSVNVYGTEYVVKDDIRTWEIVGPLYYSPVKRRLHINLLLLNDDQGNYHYCWIKDMSRLLSHQLSKTGHRKFLCDGCLQYFSTLAHLHQHQQNDCNHVYTTLPTGDLKTDKMGRLVPNHVLKFENYQKRIKVPFVVYADFETVLRPIHTCFPDPNKASTTPTHTHQPHSFAYLMKCSFDDSLSLFRTYRGPDCANRFVQTLDQDVYDVHHRYLNITAPMIPLTDEEMRLFSEATSCNICEEPFLEDDVKVRDHCHLTGKIRLGAAHSKCNLNYKLPTFVPVFFHNLSGYDCHLFLKEAAVNDVKFNVIAQNKEKYISFSKLLPVDTDNSTQNAFVKIRFLDSFRFMASSLDKLSQELDSSQCVQVKKYFPDPQHFRLMRRKGIFPYSYVDDITKLDETTFPSKEDFFDKLTSTPVSELDYQRAKVVWNIFKCSTLGDYSDLYLKTDVLLLADVFENFREICINTYDLDPAQYYTAPGLAWDSMLKSTRVNLQLLTDIDMLKFFQKGIRGGISQCVQRMHFANNPHLPDFDTSVPTSYIMYLDATNLYGHSMSQNLPLSQFRWLNEAEIDELNVQSLDASSEYGYVLEVDIEYPQCLHDLHADLPFLVENIVSPGNVNGRIKKLIPNLMNKTKYIVHYLPLKQALQNGLKLLKVHRVIQFKQSQWLKPFIDLNTQKRNMCRDKFGKSFFKLMINSTYGKTMENVDKRVDVKLVTHWQNSGRYLGAESLIAKPNFRNSKIFTPNFVAVQMNKLRVVYDKPLYIGFTVLDLSKVVMYDFYYGFLKQKYQQNVSLMYMDTDSFILKAFTDNFYRDIVENIHHFDTSNYPRDNIFDIPITTSVVGKFKDEFPNNPIKAFYGTGAKAYCVEAVDQILKKAKGVKKNVIQLHLGIDDYLRVIRDDSTILKSMNVFVSDLHVMFTHMKTKVALCPKDDKRFLIPKTTNTLPWGHYSIKNSDNSVSKFNGTIDQFIKNFDRPYTDNLTVGEYFIQKLFETSTLTDESIDNIYEHLI